MHEKQRRGCDRELRGRDLAPEQVVELVADHQRHDEARDVVVLHRSRARDPGEDERQNERKHDSDDDAKRVHQRSSSGLRSSAFAVSVRLDGGGSSRSPIASLRAFAMSLSTYALMTGSAQSK